MCKCIWNLFIRYEFIFSLKLLSAFGFWKNSLSFEFVSFSFTALWNSIYFAIHLMERKLKWNNSQWYISKCRAKNWGSAGDGHPKEKCKQFYLLCFAENGRKKETRKFITFWIRISDAPIVNWLLFPLVHYCTSHIVDKVGTRN